MDENLNEFRLAAVVVLYMPQENVIDALKSYSSAVEEIIIVDNTVAPSGNLAEKIHKQLKNAVYHPCYSNEGIAKALNIGISIALEKGYSHVLTMDQDSFFDDFHIRSFVTLAKELNWKTTGIISPVHAHGKMILPDPGTGERMHKREFVMTSGNILNLTAFNAAGGFDESLFIDHVDHDFCFKLKNSGYDVYEVENVQLDHELGDIKSVKILNRNIYKFISHSPLRNYYFFRNGFLMTRRYGSAASFIYRLMFKEIIKILFFEPNKYQRLKIVRKGYSDFKKGIFGKMK